MKPAVLLLALMVAPRLLSAQLDGASARALGMGSAYSLSARGFEAASWNPAVLALPGRPRVSVGLPQGAFGFGSNSFSLGDVARYANVKLTSADKADLLARIDTTLRVQMQARVNPVGLSIGRFAMSLSSAGEGDAGLGKDAVDLALNGNAGRSGAGEYFTADNSSGSAWAITTLALSAAWPVPTSFGLLSLGATVKRHWGRALGRTAEVDSRLGVNPAFDVTGSGHAIYTAYPAGFRIGGLGLLLSKDAPGAGYGVDLGGALVLPSGLTVGLVLVNAISAMSWQSDRLRYERVEVTVMQDGHGTVTDSTIQTRLTGAAIALDPAALALRDSMLARARPARVARAGVSYRVGQLQLTGDVMLRVTSGLDQQPAQSVSAGVEYVLWGLLPLRTGFGTDFGGRYTVSAGTGLYLGPVHIDVGAASVNGPGQYGVRVAGGLSLVFGSL